MRRCSKQPDGVRWAARAGWAAGRTGSAAALAGVLGGALALGAAGIAAGANPTAAEKNQAKHELLTLADMPAGWTSTPSTNSNSGSFSGAAQVASCIGVAAKYIEANPPEVDSPQFQNKDATEMVQNNISFFPSTKFARAAYAAMANKKTPGCMTSALNSSISSSLAGNTGVSASPLQMSKAPSPPGTTAIKVSTTVSGHGLSVPVTLLLAFFIKGQQGGALEFSSYGSSNLSSSFERHLISVAVGRM